MTAAELRRTLAAWLLILVLATGNGVLREAVLVPVLGPTAALVASGLLLSACVAIVTVTLARWLRLDSPSAGRRIGLLWLALTVAFEFGFGLVRHRTWTEMLEPYTFTDGNLWPLVLVVTVAAPAVVARVRSRRPRT